MVEESPLSGANSPQRRAKPRVRYHLGPDYAGSANNSRHGSRPICQGDRGDASAHRVELGDNQRVAYAQGARKLGFGTSSAADIFHAQPAARTERSSGTTRAIRTA